MDGHDKVDELLARHAQRLSSALNEMRLTRDERMRIVALFMDGLRLTYEAGGADVMDSIAEGMEAASEFGGKREVVDAIRRHAALLRSRIDG